MLRSACLRRLGPPKLKYKTILLNVEEVLIGRSPQATFLILSKMISRTHAVLKRNKNDWMVTDLKSMNGVFVNNTRLEPNKPYTLKNGDHVLFGQPNGPEDDIFLYEFCATFDPIPDYHHTTEIAQSSRDIKASACSSTGCSDDSQKILQEKEALKMKLEEMKKLLAEKESSEIALQEELKRKERYINEDIKLKMARLMEEKELLKEQLELEFRKQLQAKEGLIRQQLSEQCQALISEKERVEKLLSEQQNRMDVEKHLILEKQRLEEIICAKEKQQQELEMKLQEAAVVCEKSQADALKAKKEVLDNIHDILESELQCSICSELFIQATTLMCSHSFCHVCINQWISKKKGNVADCPICRMPINHQSRSFAFDAFIDKIVENLSEEMKTRRRCIIEERKNMSISINTEESSPIEISDESSQWNSDDSSSVSGDPEVYYGGYGRCYNCGQRGHWANGCPF